MPAEKRKTDTQAREETLSPTKEARRQPEPAPAVPRTPRTLCSGKLPDVQVAGVEADDCGSVAANARTTRGLALDALHGASQPAPRVRDGWGHGGDLLKWRLAGWLIGGCFLGGEQSAARVAPGPVAMVGRQPRGVLGRGTCAQAPLDQGRRRQAEN
jgi:hypothetical protein